MKRIIQRRGELVKIQKCVSISKIVEKFGALFDDKATIQNLPMQDNCFAEISTKNKNFVLRVSNLRVDLFINYDYEQEDSPILLYKQNVVNEINKFYKKVLEM